MDELQQAIEKILHSPNLQKLRLSSQKISACYQKGSSLMQDEELLTYLIVRLPATCAALKSVLSQLSICDFGTILDIGAGPAALWWAMRGKQFEKMTAIEKEPTFIELGKMLGSDVTWIQDDALTFNHFKSHDWVFFNYSLGEMPEEHCIALLEKCWSAAKTGMIIVEPGTPRGYQRIMTARHFFIENGGFVFAPCPHEQNCPLSHLKWCHFSVRLQRSSLHRQIKEGTLSFEDEKFSYLIVTKENLKSPHLSRLIDHPSLHSGHVHLSLCTSKGLSKTTVTRSQKELYKKARKLRWGDSW